MPPSASEIRALVAEETDRLVALRRQLHACPEVAYAEVETSARIQTELKAAGVPFVAGLAGGTGVLAHLPGEGDRAVALRADMDALPITEAGDRPYASRRPGYMHACGHDGHTAILVGAARVLARLARRGPLPRPVTFLFQPAEEGGAGAARMIADGALDGSRLGPRVARIFGLHGWPDLPLGVVATRPGPLLASVDTFTAEVRGTGAHAAWPHLSRDPIVAAAAAVQALQAIVSRETDPLDAGVVSVTRIEAGSANNVIPEVARLGGTVRTLSAEVRARVRRRVEEVIAGAAALHGCRAEVAFTEGYPVTENDPDAVAVFERCAREALGASRVTRLARPVMGAEDFSFYGREVSACFFVLGLLPPGAERMPSLHQPDFDFNDEAIPTGVELFCRLAAA